MMVLVCCRMAGRLAGGRGRAWRRRKSKQTALGAGTLYTGSVLTTPAVTPVKGHVRVVRGRLFEHLHSEVL